jgi:hypothetical protein
MGFGDMAVGGARTNLGACRTRYAYHGNGGPSGGSGEGVDGRIFAAGSIGNARMIEPSLTHAQGPRYRRCERIAADCARGASNSQPNDPERSLEVEARWNS